MAYNNQINNQALQGGGNLVQLPQYGQQYQGGVEELLNQLRGKAFQGLQNPTQGFGDYEKAARRGFEQDTIPLLAQRAANLGSLNSSGYRNSLTRAGTNFELGLNQQRQQFGQQNIGNLLQMLQTGLRPTQENVFTPPGGGFGSAIAGGLGTGVGLAGTLGLSSALGEGGALAGLGTTAAGGLTALAAQPWFWPVLAALAAGGGLYAYSQSGD